MKFYPFVFALLLNLNLMYAQQPYQLYFGNLHSHTSNSDGQLSPYDAYVYARDSAGLHFLAVTDHLDQLSSSEYQQMQAQAAATTVQGSFTSIFGYEWSSPYYGHINVFNTTEMPSILTYSDWSGFRSWMLARPQAFAMFNHPGDEDYFNNWYDFEYKGAATDTSFPLLEVQNVQQATDWYEFALNEGWHLSPVWNQDNHQANWGNKNEGRAGVWATDITVSSLFHAMRAGRTFATMDKNASVWIDVFGHPMGLTLPRYQNMPFRIQLNDAENEPYQTVELVTNNGVIMSFAPQGNIDTIIPLTLYTDMYVFVRAIQADGDYLWSGPVYFQGLVTDVPSLGDAVCNLYPNPASEYFNVSFSDNRQERIKIVVSDITGKTLMEHFAETVPGQTLHVPLTKNIKGFVTVSITTSERIYYRKLFVVE